MAEQLPRKKVSFDGHAPVTGVMPNISASAQESLHELRVRIPVDLHRQLLSLKILRGKSLAETVSTALDMYFEDRAREIAEQE